jgi:hypothetical protein
VWRKLEKDSVDQGLQRCLKRHEVIAKLGTPKKLVGVADELVPAELSTRVDDLSAAGAGGRQVAAVQHDVRSPLQVDDDSLEPRQESRRSRMP